MPRSSQPMRGAVIALALGMLTSAGLVAERLSAGSTLLAVCLLISTLSFTVVAMLLLRPIARRLPRANQRDLAVLIAVQVGAVLLGVALTHAAVAFSVDTAGLREAPAQLVNDAILGVGLILLIWSFLAKTHSMRLATGAAAFALVALYQATATLWHVDTIAFSGLTIQQFVSSEVLAVAAGLLIVDWLGVRYD